MKLQGHGVSRRHRCTGYGVNTGFGSAVGCTVDESFLRQMVGGDSLLILAILVRVSLVLAFPGHVPGGLAALVEGDEP